jgi:hypothetical protein
MRDAARLTGTAGLYLSGWPPSFLPPGDNFIPQILQYLLYNTGGERPQLLSPSIQLLRRKDEQNYPPSRDFRRRPEESGALDGDDFQQ